MTSATNSDISHLIETSGIDEAKPIPDWHCTDRAFLAWIKTMHVNDIPDPREVDLPPCSAAQLPSVWMVHFPNHLYKKKCPPGLEAHAYFLYEGLSYSRRITWPEGEPPNYPDIPVQKLLTIGINTTSAMLKIAKLHFLTRAQQREVYHTYRNSRARTKPLLPWIPGLAELDPALTPERVKSILDTGLQSYLSPEEQVLFGIL